MKRCSIIIPVYNRAALTRQCLDLVFALLPEGNGCEVIVVNDGSVDGTAEMLVEFSSRLRIVTHAANAGFASACNAGAAAATGSSLVFLNNDTRPTPGWLESLLDYAERHPAAAVVGAKLLYPDDTVQHAGVVISHDRYPRHIYCGFPANHSAVMKSRRFQAVTAACAFVRREAFHEVHGFDTAYRNGLEDIDLCLALGERGHEIHYCHESVLYHLESVSEGRFRSNNENTRLYNERWAHRVQPDDLRYYAEDGLVHIDYVEANRSPLRLSVSPLLALVEGNQQELARLLRLRSRQVHVLLQEVIRLTTQALEMGSSATTLPQPDGPISIDSRLGHDDGCDLRQVLLDVEAELLHRDESTVMSICRDNATGPHGTPPEAGERCSPSQRLVYECDLIRLRERIPKTLPSGKKVAVVSRGDEELLDLGGLTGLHFPQDEEGRYAGHYPSDSDDAIRQLESLRERGVEYLLFPRSGLWWLEHYAGFRKHLEERYPIVVRDERTCVVFSLSEDLGCNFRHSDSDDSVGRQITFVGPSRVD
jgi:GT2 family glycosyltransferase